MKIKIIAVQQGTTGAGGWDVDMRVDGIDCGVTLLPRKHDGRPAAWGSLDNWMSHGLQQACDGNNDLISEVEARTAAAIEASGLDPASSDLDME